MKYISEQFEFDFRQYKGILAMSKNRCIGFNGILPWNKHKEDLQWFKEFTENKNKNKVVVMGRKTFQSLPPLKNRCIYILSSNIKPVSINGYVFDCIISPDFTSSVHLINDINSLPNYKEIIIAGGKSIYELFMPLISELYVTHIDKDYHGDTFMEPFEHLFSQEKVIKEFDFGRIVRYNK